MIHTQHGECHRNVDMIGIIPISAAQKITSQGSEPLIDQQDVNEAEKNQTPGTVAPTEEKSNLHYQIPVDQIPREDETEEYLNFIETHQADGKISRAKLLEENHFWERFLVEEGICDPVNESGGDNSHLVGGFQSKLSAGSYSILRGGSRSEIQAGNNCVVEGDYHCRIKTGEDCIVTAGPGSIVAAGEGSILKMEIGGYGETRHWVAKVGEGRIEPNTPYQVNGEGLLVEVFG